MMMTNISIAPSYLEHIKSQLLDDADLDAFVAACQRPLRKSIRVNTLKISVEDFKKRANSYGWKLDVIPWCQEGFWLEISDDELKLGNHPDHVLGLFYIQEASSMLPATALLDADTENSPFRLLDMAAAPGSKTTQLAAKVNNQGCIVANELSASRIKSLHANLLRCGVSNTALTHLDARLFADFCFEAFDAILLDAPCGGEGTVRKDPQALANWQLERVEGLSKLQYELALAAIHALKVGGELVYSTCTLSKEENSQVVLALLAAYPDALAIESLSSSFEGAERVSDQYGMLTLWPQRFDSEGFFIAKVRKIKSIPFTPKSNRLGKFPYEPISEATYQKLSQALVDSFSLSIDDLKARIWQKDNTLWLFPEHFDELIGQIKFDRIGLKVADIHTKNFKFYHEFISCFGTRAKKATYPCRREQANAWYRGQSIELDDKSLPPIVILNYEGSVIGFGKNIRGKVKNNLPRDIVKQIDIF